MGKQAGHLKITGTFHDLTFYKMGDQYFVRRKGGPSRKQVLRSPSFVNSRRNIAEFTQCSRDAGLLRRSIRNLVHLRTPYHRRLNKLLLTLKNDDRTSVWGERCMEQALKTNEARTKLMHFDFIRGRKLNADLKDRISIAKDKTFRISDFSLKHIGFPKGAHLVLLTPGLASIDFKGRNTKVSEYESILVDRQTKLKEIVLRPLSRISSPGYDFYILHLQFFTKEGKEILEFNSKQSDVLSIIAINPHLQARPIKKKRNIINTSLLEKLNLNIIPLAVPSAIGNLERTAHLGQIPP